MSDKLHGKEPLAQETAGNEMPAEPLASEQAHVSEIQSNADVKQSEKTVQPDVVPSFRRIPLAEYAANADSFASRPFRSHSVPRNYRAPDCCTTFVHTPQRRVVSVHRSTPICHEKRVRREAEAIVRTTVRELPPVIHELPAVVRSVQYLDPVIITHPPRYVGHSFTAWHETAPRVRTVPLPPASSMIHFGGDGLFNHRYTHYGSPLRYTGERYYTRSSSPTVRVTPLASWSTPGSPLSENQWSPGSTSSIGTPTKPQDEKHSVAPATDIQVAAK